MIRVPRPPSNPNVGALVAAIERRIPFTVNRGSGYSNPDYRWRWCCPVCPFTCEAREKSVCQTEADAHKCEGAWCAVPMTPERAGKLGVAPRVKVGDKEYSIYEPTPDDRKRWAERKRLDEIAARTADRVVPFPGGYRG